MFFLINRYLQKCKTSEFLAPEQQYNYNQCKNNMKLGYSGLKRATSKSDVWKIPEMVKLLLQKIPKEYKSINLDLNEIFYHCKKADPKSRWNSTKVLHSFEHIREKFSLM